MNLITNGNTTINQLQQHQGKRGKEREEENVASACAVVWRMCGRGKEKYHRWKNGITSDNRVLNR